MKTLSFFFPTPYPCHVARKQLSSPGIMGGRAACACALHSFLTELGKWHVGFLFENLGSYVYDRMRARTVLFSKGISTALFSLRSIRHARACSRCACACPRARGRSRRRLILLSRPLGGSAAKWTNVVWPIKSRPTNQLTNTHYSFIGIDKQGEICGQHPINQKSQPKQSMHWTNITTIVGESTHIVNRIKSLTVPRSAPTKDQVRCLFLPIVLLKMRYENVKLQMRLNQGPNDDVDSHEMNEIQSYQHN